MPRILETLAGLWSRQAMPDAALRSAVAHEEKASATGPLILLETLGRPVWTPRDYEAFAREGFMQNAIVYRAVRMIAEAAASVPLLLYEGDDEQEHHPLLDLLARPSLDQTGTDFFEAWYGYLLVAGNAYVEAVALDGKLRELHALRPDRMKVVPGAEGWPEAYEYTCAGRTIRFEEEPVSGVRAILHVRLFHPVNDHYGMSPIEAAAQAIDIHNTAGRWNKALLDNSARPSGALVYGGADGRMSPEQFERLKAELEDGFQGPKRAGRPLLLEGGLDWKPLSLSPKDMDFIAARNGAAREIALAFGVPPMLLGIPGDNTFSNYQEAQRAFWRSTVLPLVTRTAKALASWLAPAWNTSLELRPDLDQIEALTSEREALWARIEKVSFLTLNEKRAAVGYTPLEEQPSAATESDASIVVRKYPAEGGYKYRPDQARAPRGDADGGQWVDEGGGSGGGSGSRILSDANSDDVDLWRPGAQVAQAEKPPPGVGHNKPPVKIPDTRPPSNAARISIFRAVTRGAGTVGVALATLEVAHWAATEGRGIVSSYFDDPKSLDELKRSHLPREDGYDDHHVIERGTGKANGFSSADIESHDNIVRIPRIKHWQLNGWYATPNINYGGLTPRQHLREKSLEENRRVGLEALREHGVLKP